MAELVGELVQAVAEIGLVLKGHGLLWMFSGGTWNPAERGDFLAFFVGLLFWIITGFGIFGIVSVL